MQPDLFYVVFFLEPGAARKMLDDEERVRRAADREGRRTRRRQIRERADINNTHLDGMSSDDEIHQDLDVASYRVQLGKRITYILHICIVLKLFFFLYFRSSFI